MHILNKQLYEQLNSVNLLLTEIDTEKYTSKIEVIGNPSIRQQVRYVLENVLEHTNQHLALIKVGLKLVSCDCTTNDFGLAYSIKKYREQICAQ